MKNNIAIVGAGLFGLTTYLVLRKNGFNCTLFDKNKDILLGASTNNLNRVHFGYHYPRDYETAAQSLKGYKSFKKFYKKSIIHNFDNYYFIAKSSKVGFKKYLKFCVNNKLKFKNLKFKKFLINTSKIQGSIKVNEPIYDWSEIKKIAKKKLKQIKNNSLKLNEEVIEIQYKKKFLLKTKKNQYIFDQIVDTSYEGSNKISKKISEPKKFIFQQVIVHEFTSNNFNKLGLALMDGNFFSFLPKGKTNKHILYHVQHSVLRNRIAKQFPNDWYFAKISKNKVKSSRYKIMKDIRKYLPGLNVKFNNKYYVSPRIFPTNLEKSDKRISKILKIKKGYFKILSAKVDHSVDIAYELLKFLKS